MNLSGKTLRLLAAVALFGAIATWTVQRLVVVPEFAAIEEKEARHAVDHCVAALRREADHLAKLAADYGRWDDSWNFVETRSPEFVESNLVAETFTRTPLSVVQFLGPDGRTIWGEAHDETTGETVALPPFAGDSLPANHPLLGHHGNPGGVRGFVRSADAILFVAAMPILRTDGSGPCRGTLVMAQRVSDEVVAGVRRRTGVTFRLAPPGAAETYGEDPQGDGVRLAAASDGRTHTAWRTVPSIDGTPAFVVEAEVPREISPGGSLAATIAALLQVAIGAAVLLVVHFRLRDGVIAPVARLGAAVRGIATTGDHASRVPEEGPEEIGGLGADINGMLARIEAAEAALVRAKEAAEANALAKTRFLASVSHEVRTPMIGVLAMTDHLLESGLDPEQRECAGMVRRSAHLMLGVLNDVLDLSKIEAGKLTLTEAETDVRDVAESVAEIAAWPAHAKGLRLVCDVVPGVPSLVRGDQVRLRQALLNLATNAVKFTERGEIVIRVTAESLEGDRVLLRFEVADTGPGIAAEDRPKLFIPYSQLDPAAKRSFGGTGLGLALVRELATQMGGDVGVDSTLGRGSSFWFTASLPVLPEPAARTSASATSKRLLVVASSVAASQAILHAVEPWSPGAGWAPSVAEAVRLARFAAAEHAPFDAAVIGTDVEGGTQSETISAIRAASPRTAIVRLHAAGGPRTDAAAPASKTAGGSPVPTADHPVRAAQLRRRVADAIAFHAVASLPLRRGPAPAVPSPPSVPQRVSGSWSVGTGSPPPGPALRVLVAEDNPVSAQLVQLVLRKRGYDVRHVPNGAEAVAAVRDGRCDVVLMDSQMPGMDGVEATIAIRALPGAASRMPVIALTANVFPEELQRFEEAGCDAFVPKPFDVAQLADTIERFRPGCVA